MDQVDLIISVAERVKRLRGELAAAEADLTRLVRGRGPGRPPKMSAGRAPAEGTPTRIARVLARRGPLEFAELVAAVQPATKAAVKSALVKGRERGTFAFRGGKYQLTERKKAPKDSSSGA